MEEATVQLHLPEQEVSFCGEALLSEAFSSYNQTSWVPHSKQLNAWAIFLPGAPLKEICRWDWVDKKHFFSDKLLWFVQV